MKTIFLLLFSASLYGQEVTMNVKYIGYEQIKKKLVKMKFLKGTDTVYFYSDCNRFNLGDSATITFTPVRPHTKYFEGNASKKAVIKKQAP